MRRLLVIALLAVNSFVTGISNSSQTTTQYLSENFTKTVEVMSTNHSATKYMYFTHGIFTGNLPVGMPVAEEGFHRISDYYGLRKKHPVHGRRCMHHGIDFSGKRGTAILSAGAGVVEKVTYSASYGKMIYIDHGNNVTSIYAHLKKFNVKKGQRVNMGEQIAELGSTGWSTGPHLHFEVRINGEAIDPTLLLFGNRSKDESTIISEMCNQKTLSDERAKTQTRFTGPILPFRSGDSRPASRKETI